jgi:hypothetical protein
MVDARLLASVLVLLLPGPALAWGDLGHRIICEIAFQERGQIARDRVKAMIDRDPEFDTFAKSCTWPDHPRRRATEHYVNLPRDADGLEEDPCPLATECVVSAIEQDLAVLSSSSATEQQRLEALKFLGHWVGDVHQPLHVSFEDDRGGNEIGVSGGLCSWNLHAVWDRCIIEQGRPGDPCTIARDLLDNVTDEDRATGGPPSRSNGRPNRWRSPSVPKLATASRLARAGGAPRTISVWTTERSVWTTKNRRRPC